jgi:lactoylglutathione lyase
MVKKLLHTRMRVNDLARTVKFYEEALGLKVSRRHTSPRGAQLAFIATPNSDEEIEICQMPPGAPSVVVQPDLMHLAFEVDDLVAFAAAAAAKGYPLSDGPTPSGSGMIAFIDAPEGYEVELIERKK